MKDILFHRTIQYLDSLYDEGLFDREQVEKLARFSLELGGVKTPEKPPHGDSHSHKFSTAQDTSDILSDVLSDNWG